MAVALIRRILKDRGLRPRLRNQRPLWAHVAALEPCIAIGSAWFSLEDNDGGYRGLCADFTVLAGRDRAKALEFGLFKA
jgi:hypothetical protein